MIKPKLIRITTVPLSLDKLLEGQLSYMRTYYDVTAISADEKYLKKVAAREGVGYYQVQLTRKITPFKDIMAVYKLYKYFKKEKPHIVHTHTPKAGIVGMIAAYLASVPHRLHTVAGLPLLEATGLKRKILNAVEKLTYKTATNIYPNSQGLKEIILTQGFTTSHKLKVIGKGSSNGIDTSYFDPLRYTQDDHDQLKKSIGIPAQDFVFVFVGRLVGDKGINELVSAFTKVQDLYENSSLVLVGPFEEALDPLEKSTEAILKDHPKIFCVGYQDDVRPYYAFAKALVFPSYREGFPNVVLQAAAMGLPCIVSDINGCNEIIKNDFNGMIVPVKNDIALKDAMLQLMEHPENRESLASNTRESIVKHYERKEIWQAILTEYNRLQE